MAEPCAHERCDARVEVVRLTEHQGGPVTGFRADVRVWCADCDEPFEFLGPLPVGVLPDQPTTGVFRTELRVPLRPASAPDGFGLDVPGVTMTMRPNFDPERRN